MACDTQKHVKEDLQTALQNLRTEVSAIGFRFRGNADIGEEVAAYIEAADYYDKLLEDDYNDREQQAREHGAIVHATKAGQ